MRKMTGLDLLGATDTTNLGFDDGTGLTDEEQKKFYGNQYEALKKLAAMPKAKYSNYVAPSAADKFWGPATAGVTAAHGCHASGDTDAWIRFFVCILILFALVTVLRWAMAAWKQRQQVDLLASAASAALTE